MDIVGSLGYIGQTIHFIDGERFAYITGNSLCIYDTTKGPREMLWKTDRGISSFAACMSTQSMIYTPILPSVELQYNVEVVNTADQTEKGELLNPAVCPIIYLAFSRDGDKIFGITGTIDHRLLVWSNGNGFTLLVNKELPKNFLHCSSNPCNSNQVILTGRDGIMVGIVSEVLGTYSLKLEEVDLERVVQGTGEPSSKVPIAIWLPMDRILIIDQVGNTFEYKVESKKVRNLGSFFVPDKRGNSVQVVPTHAVLSVGNLIVGTEQGMVYWYPVLNLMSPATDSESLLDAQIPAQACNVRSAVSSLSVDQNFLTLLVGTFAGEVFKVAVDVAENEFAKLDQLDQELLASPYGGAAADAGKQVKQVESVVPMQMGNDAHSGGVVLCTNHLTIEVQKFSARSRSSLSMFITGSHLGSLLFWRYSSQVVDSMSPGGGIRRSAPRALRSVFQLVLKGQQLPSTNDNVNPPAISAIELVSLPMKHARLLWIGTEDGGVEVWTLEAQENEDEDAKDSGAAEDKNGLSVRMLEDDEGSCLVRLEARRIFHAKLYEEPLSLFAAYPVSLLEKDQHFLRVAAASDADKRIHFFNAIKDEQIAVQKGVESFLTLEGDCSLRSMIWSDDHLFLSCEDGSVLVYQTKDAEIPVLKRNVVTGLPFLVDATFTTSMTMAVLLTNSHQVQLGAVRALYDEKTSLELRSLEHSDIVVLVAHAPNGRYFVTGCVDGSLYIWKIELETEEVTLANKLKPHAGSVSSLAFSTDSSLLMSSAIDGSCFFITLDKPTMKGPNRNGSIKASFVQEEGPQYLSDILPESAFAATAGSLEKEQQQTQDGQPLLTWIEQKEIEKAKDLKSRHKFKAMGIGAAINEIGQRLRVLVSQNAARSELEILDRGEFVIDVARKDAVIASNAQQASVTRRLYAQRNFCNELRAARIRSKCFDRMEVRSVALLPLLPALEVSLAAGVTSFPVLKYTNAEQTALSKVKRLRGMEVRAQRLDELGEASRVPGTPFYRCAWFTAIAGCPQAVSWISNEGTRWPVADKVANLLAADKTAAAAGSAGASGSKDKDKAVPEGLSAPSEVDDDDGSVDSREDQEIDENNVMNLLYPPQAVRSQVQKRTQIVLLKEIVRQLKLKFNEQLEKLRGEKTDIIGSIDSRNTRMLAILEDLHQHENLFSPSLGNRELAGSAIVVDASELSSTPYESEANRAIRLRAEEEKRLRDLENDKEDVKGRALEEMMHGTLEVKRDVFAEASGFVRPEWMDTLTAAEMNETQLKEYDAYMTKLKALQEEQANYRKALEQEMKRLKNEVTDLCKAFDEKLNDLVSLKVLVHREILSQEIYVARLCHNMAMTEKTFKFLRKSEEQVQALRVDRAELRRGIEQLSSELEDMKGKINAIQEEERQMDKTFQRDLQNLTNTTFDQNAFKVLKQLFRNRAYPRGGYEVEQNGYASEQDASASASKNHRRSKDNSASARGGKNSKSQSKRGGGGLGSSSTNDGNKGNKRMKASKGGASAGGGGKDAGSLGPMQQAAQALRSSEEANYKDRDPYYEALLEQEKVKLTQEAQIPILSVQSIELDCPEGFDIDQFSWSKLQELRTARIEKEIEGKLLSIEFSKLKQKLERLDAEDSMVVACIADIKSSRDLAVEALEDLDGNLDIIVRLRQGQDEVDKDAVVTDYSDALLLPSTVISKYNSRIKELGREKISVLSKIKLFRRKINLIDWEAKHFGLEARHYEAYLTDLQLFRVTRMLQKIIREGSDASLNKVNSLYYL